MEKSDASTTKKVSPIAPHILMYDFPLSAMFSGAHRLSGLGLYVVTSVSVLLSSLYMLNGGANSVYQCIAYLSGTVIGKIFVWLCGTMLAFHMVSGIKYLVMDIQGEGIFDKKNIPVWTGAVALTAMLLSGVFGFIIFR